MADPFYRKPYFDSTVFIGWIKGESVNEAGTVIDRGKIAEHLLTLAEQQVFPIVISALTIAEVHKKKGQQKLSGDQNQNLLDYFENDFVSVVAIDRQLGEEANRLCRLYESEGLSPADAIHLASAKKAGCDVLLSWDNVLNSIKDPSIRTERPVIWSPKPKPIQEEMFRNKEPNGQVQAAPGPTSAPELSSSPNVVETRQAPQPEEAQAPNLEKAKGPLENS